MIKIEGADWEILKILYKAKQMSGHPKKEKVINNTSLAKQLNISKPTVSEFLKNMNKVGLIIKDGRFFYLSSQGIWYAEFYIKARKRSGSK